jgi:hypothetical protein
MVIADSTRKLVGDLFELEELGAQNLKGAENNCYTVIPSGKNKWSIQKGSTAVAVWSK